MRSRTDRLDDALGDLNRTEEPRALSETRPTHRNHGTLSVTERVPSAEDPGAPTGECRTDSTDAVEVSHSWCEEPPKRRKERLLLCKIRTRILP